MLVSMRNPLHSSCNLLFAYGLQMRDGSAKREKLVEGSLLMFAHRKVLQSEISKWLKEGIIMYVLSWSVDEPLREANNQVYFMSNLKWERLSVCRVTYCTTEHWSSYKARYCKRFGIGGPGPLSRARSVTGLKWMPIGKAHWRSGIVYSIIGSCLLQNTWNVKY